MTSLKETASDLVHLARDEGAKDVVVEAFDRSIQLVRFSNSEVDSTLSWSEKHAHVFAAVGKRTLVTDIRDLGAAAEGVKALVRAVKNAPENKEYGGIASGRFKYKPGRPDPAIVSLKDPAKHVRDAIGSAHRAGADNVGGTLYVRHEVTGIASSGGALASDESASMELSVRAFSQPEASGHSVSVTPRLVALRAKETGARAGELSVMAKNPVQGEQGKFDIIVEPLFLGSIMHFSTRMMSAVIVDIGMSMYARRIGKKVASAGVTIADDPLMRSSSRRAFDHEGAPTRRNIVVKDGVLRTYLHNTSTAKKYRTKTTGNTGPFVPTSGGAGRLGSRGDDLGDGARAVLQQHLVHAVPELRHWGVLNHPEGHHPEDRGRRGRGSGQEHTHQRQHDELLEERGRALEGFSGGLLVGRGEPPSDPADGQGQADERDEIGLEKDGVSHAPLPSEALSSMALTTPSCPHLEVITASPSSVMTVAPLVMMFLWT